MSIFFFVFFVALLSGVLGRYTPIQVNSDFDLYIEMDQFRDNDDDYQNIRITREIGKVLISQSANRGTILNFPHDFLLDETKTMKPTDVTTGLTDDAASHNIKEVTILQDANNGTVLNFPKKFRYQQSENSNTAESPTTTTKYTAEPPITTTTTARPASGIPVIPAGWHGITRSGPVNPDHQYERWLESELKKRNKTDVGFNESENLTTEPTTITTEPTTTKTPSSSTRYNSLRRLNELKREMAKLEGDMRDRGELVNGSVKKLRTKNWEP